MKVLCPFHFPAGWNKVLKNDLAATKMSVTHAEVIFATTQTQEASVDGDISDKQVQLVN